VHLLECGLLRGSFIPDVPPALDHIGHLDAMIAKLDAQIEAMMQPFRAQRDLLITIPGIGLLAAAAILSEIGSTSSGSSSAPTWPPGPGSARATTNTPGNDIPASVAAATSVETVWSAGRHEGYLNALYHRHVMKWGSYRSPTAKKKAIIVVAHANARHRLACPGHRQTLRRARRRFLTFTGHVRLTKPHWRRP
jgi:hypothetical protein